MQREYYINDAGTQVAGFGDSLYLRYLQALAARSTKDDRLPWRLHGRDGTARSPPSTATNSSVLPEDEAQAQLNAIGLEKVLASIRSSVICWASTSTAGSRNSLYTDGTFEQVMAALREAGLTEFKEGAVWLRTSAMGSDKDEVLIRSDGRPGYYASDVAYHYNKFVARGFDRVIDVWAVDHQNQARRMPFLMKALGLDPARLTIVLYDLVRLYRDGQEVKLSKRSGDIITVDEVVDEVGADAVRFLLLTRSNKSVMDFDLNLAVKQNDENPVYYVQYAHAAHGEHLAYGNGAWVCACRVAKRRPGVAAPSSRAGVGA